MECSRLHRSSCNSNHRLQPLAHPESPQERNARSNTRHCAGATHATIFSAFRESLEPTWFTSAFEQTA
jgi:hypothetical protein